MTLEDWEEILLQNDLILDEIDDTWDEDSPYPISLTIKEIKEISELLKEKK